MEYLRKVVRTNKEPDEKEVLWVDTAHPDYPVMKYYENGNWKLIRQREDGVAYIMPYGGIPYSDLSQEVKMAIASGGAQANWNQTNSASPDFIWNKPYIPTALADLTEDSNHKFVSAAEKTSWSNKADRVQSAVAGHIATLDSSGNLVDSGKGISDINPLWGNIQGSIENQTDLMSALGDKYEKPSTGIPASDLADGVIPDVSNFITASVNNLVNYYKKTETYTQEEVQALIGAIQQFHYEIYASTAAVTNPQGNVLYLIGPTGSGEDKYEEYVYSNNTWVKIGDTSINLSNYVTTSDLNTALSAYTTTANLTTLLAGKQDIISDLATIRSGASAGATAIQSVKTINNQSIVGTGNLPVRELKEITITLSPQEGTHELGEISVAAAALGITATEMVNICYGGYDVVSLFDGAMALTSVYLTERAQQDVGAEYSCTNQGSVLRIQFIYEEDLVTEDDIVRYTFDRIDAYEKPATGIPASDLAAGVIPTVPTDVVKYSSQSLTDAQKTQARNNIGASVPELLVAEYNVTPFATVITACLAGENVIVKKNENYKYVVYSLTMWDGDAQMGGTVKFSRINYSSTTSGTIDTISVDNVDGWKTLESIPYRESFFIAQYGVTHWSEVLAAYKDGKVLLCRLTTLAQLMVFDPGFEGDDESEPYEGSAAFIYYDPIEKKLIQLVIDGSTDEWQMNRLRYVSDFDGRYASLSGKPTIPDVTGKADKVSGATNGHLAALDSNGNLADSGKSASDFQPTIDSSHKLSYTLLSDTPTIPDAVEANPTVPSGTTPTALTGLKIGANFYDVAAEISALSNNDIDSIWNTAMA